MGIAGDPWPMWGKPRKRQEPHQSAREATKASESGFSVPGREPAPAQEGVSEPGLEPGTLGLEGDKSRTVSAGKWLIT